MHEIIRRNVNKLMKDLASYKEHGPDAILSCIFKECLETRDKLLEILKKDRYQGNERDDVSYLSIRMVIETVR